MLGSLFVLTAFSMAFKYCRQLFKSWKLWVDKLERYQYSCGSLSHESGFNVPRGMSRD